MADFKLDPEMQAFVDNYLEISGLSTANSIEQQRRDYNLMARHFCYQHPPQLVSHDATVNGRHGGIPLRQYRHGEGNDQVLILFVHGGGFIFGSLDSHDDICAELCADTGYDLVSVDYRLSPEYYHPTHLDDVEDAFRALGHGNTILVGVSGGGTLCAALCHRLAASSHRPAGQVLIYPGLGGDRLDLASYRENAEAPLLTTADIAFYRGTRCPGGELPLDDPEFYPLVADDFGQTPPSIAISAAIDPLRDDARIYVEKLQAAGVAAEWINEPGMVHDYLRARHVSSAAGAAFARIGDAIRRLAAAVTTTN